MSSARDALQAWNACMGPSTPEQWAERIMEEAAELNDETMGKWWKGAPTDEWDLPRVAREMADLRFVLTGFELTVEEKLGVDADKAFELVCDSNMAKMGSDGKPIRRESDGKIMKPDGWTAPDMSKALR